MQLNELLARYEAEYVPTIIDKARTKSCLKHLAAGLPFEASGVTHQTLLNYRQARVAAGVSESTCNREMAVLGSAYKWAVREGLVASRPETPRTRETARADALTFPQFQKLLEAAPDTKTWAFIGLLFYTGQRKEAVLGLKHDQIRGGLIHFEDEDGPLAHRRKRRATIPVGSKIKEILARLRKEFGQTVYVIPNGPEGRFVTLDKLFRLAVEKAGLPSWVTPHVLRHSCCSVLLGNGRPILEVSRYLGHSSVQITQKHYAHFDRDFLRQSSSLIDSL